MNELKLSLHILCGVVCTICWRMVLKKQQPQGIWQITHSFTNTQCHKHTETETPSEYWCILLQRKGQEVLEIITVLDLETMNIDRKLDWTLFIPTDLFLWPTELDEQMDWEINSFFASDLEAAKSCKPWKGVQLFDIHTYSAVSEQKGQHNTHADIQHKRQFEYETIEGLIFNI